GPHQPRRHGRDHRRDHARRDRRARRALPAHAGELATGDGSAGEGGPMSVFAPASARVVGDELVSKAEERHVIFASSLGTIFEWYDFYLYAVLAPFFSKLFFPPGNDTAALLSAFVSYAAGFLVRPFGALVFGRIGDLVGRKDTF